MIHDYANKVTDAEYSMFMSVMHVSVSKHLWDEHFTVIWANDFFYELIGYPKAEYEARFHNHVDEYYAHDPDAVPMMAKIIEGAYQRGEPGYEYECPMPTKSGKQAWIRVTGRFTDEVHEGLPVIYTIYTDITALKEMQLALEKALHAAEEANLAKSDFLSRMSHDIRTPMNAIVGMTEIANAHLEDPEKVRDCLKKISYSSHHLLGLINDVLDMSKIESGKMMPNLGPLFLPELVENTVTITQPAVKQRGQQFSVRLHNVRHERFESDALRLRQVLINLLSNACKFTPEGGSITVDIEETPVEQAGASVFTFTVADTGIGMKPEFLERIFEVFTREQDSRVDKTEGSGLGMAITKKIVDMLGGSITVHSRVGEGSVFTVRLPVRTSQSEAEETQLPAVNILVADDDEIVCEYAVHVLKGCGAAADCALSGREAVSKVEEAHDRGKDYDIVILDWQMPEQDGVSTARMIRGAVGDTLPILMISAYDWTDVEDEARGAGVTGFLQKPLFRSTLVHNLQRCLLGQAPVGNRINCKRDSDFTGKTFLVVEDNELNLEIAQELLSARGAAIEAARNGEEGLNKFASSPVGHFDLILMDIQMPVMNGFTATRKIRELPRKDARTVPILAMTADAFTEDVEAALDAGMNGHLAKPLEVATLDRMISGCLEQRGPDKT